MLFISLAFLAGDVFLQSFSHLPSLTIICLCLVASIGGYFVLREYSRFSIVLPAFVFGICCANWYAASVLGFTLPANMEGVPVIATGYIASLPVTNRDQTQFIFHVKSLRVGTNILNINTHIQLHWQHAPASLHVGDYRQLAVQLKRIHGVMNPGAFDMEAWALQKGLRATGSVIRGSPGLLLSRNPFRYPVTAGREYLYFQLKKHSPHSETASWLLALTIGERNNIGADQWNVLRKTGTNHLMAVGGLHIGMAAGLIHWVVNKCWRRAEMLMLRLPAQLAADAAALFVAWFYSALAGFSLPAQRACLMLTVYLSSRLLRQNLHAWHGWSVALIGVLLLNPASVLSESFWLSFATIALIIYGMSGRLHPQGKWWHWGRAQWVIGIGLIPFSLWLFQETSITTFIANTVAIPWLGFLILPFCLLAVLFIPLMPDVSGLLLMIADTSLSGLWFLLTLLSQLSVSTWHHAVTPIAMMTTLAACLILLVPAGFPGRYLVLIWMLPLFFYQSAKPQIGEVWLSLLDVGQGLSVVVRTQSHTLLYDAGPSLTPETDMGERVVVPVLRAMGINRIDQLIISHGDNDHLGGAQAVSVAFPVTSVLTSVPDKIQFTSASYCLNGYQWRWDGVDFRFLYPLQDELALGNDSSCVLQINNGAHRVLLTGDIEKFAESHLLSRAANYLSSDIIVAPHHGSKTSGMKEFIKAVNPQWVLYATGYRNRYHFPHQNVVDTYKEIGASQLNTVDKGAIFFDIKQELSIKTFSYRVAHHRYWYDENLISLTEIF